MLMTPHIQECNSKDASVKTEAGYLVIQKIVADNTLKSNASSNT